MLLKRADAVQQPASPSATDLKPRISTLRLLGPAFVAAVAYVDPGNYATNIQAGARYGYLLLWVVLWASLIGVLIQLLSAKLGIATRSSLATLIRSHLPRWASYAYWLQAEILAIATDLAEVVGAALGFHLLFGISLLLGAIVTALLSSLILAIEKRGLKPLEHVIAAMLAAVALIYVAELVLSRPDPVALVTGTLVPRVSGVSSVLLIAGILGATVMPHVIYLHSSLSLPETRSSTSPRTLYRAATWDVGIAMTVATFVNLAMLAMAAATLHGGSSPDIGSIEEAYRTLAPVLGPAAVHVFGASLIIAGLSSTVVGTLAGQEIMADFTDMRIPLWARRAITLLPSLALIAIGTNVTTILVVSQIVLSFGIGLAIVPLLLLTSHRGLMGNLANSRVTSLLGWLAVLLILTLNVVVLVGNLA
ncbi:Nramp family divalent metal transporter [Sphingomonas oryzagri]